MEVSRPDRAKAKDGSGKPQTGRVTPPNSGRYTPPIPKEYKVSPTWVPVLMFALIIVGSLVIILNYVGVLGGVSNIKLVIGLGLILAGIIAATQYR